MKIAIASSSLFILGERDPVLPHEETKPGRKYRSGVNCFSDGHMTHLKTREKEFY
jgi:hypothetical protein